MKPNMNLCWERVLIAAILIGSCAASTTANTTPVSTQTSTPQTSTSASTTTAPTPTSTQPASTTANPTQASTPTSTPQTSTSASTTTAPTPTSTQPASTTANPTQASTPTSTPQISTSASTTPASTPTSTQPASTTANTTQALTRTSTPQASTSESTTQGPTSEAATQSTTSKPPTPLPTTTYASTSTAAPSTTKYPVAVLPEFQTLDLTIGQNKDSNAAIFCQIDCNETTLTQKLKMSFINTPGYRFVREINSSLRKKRSTSQTYLFQIFFSSKEMFEISAESRKNKTSEALEKLKSFYVSVNDTALQAITDYMEKRKACPIGFTFKTDLCLSRCEELHSKCGDKGQCRINIESDYAFCLCTDDDEYEYSGQFCSESSRNRSKVIAIVAGVLGAFSGLCIVIIIILCCCKRKGGSSYKTKREFSSGVSNNAYSGIAME